MVTLTSDLSALKSYYKNWGLGIGDWAAKAAAVNRQEGQGGIIEQVSALSAHLPCLFPMPNTPYPILNYYFSQNLKLKLLPAARR